MRKLLWILLFILPVTAKSQTGTITISSDLRGTDFEYFVTKVEQTHPVKFYYDPSWTDSIKMDYPQGTTELNEILRSALASQGIYSTINSHGQVILSKDVLIRKELLGDYFKVPESLSGRKKLDAREKETNGNRHGTGGTDNGSQVIYIGSASQRSQGTEATLSGYITEAETGEPIIGAVVYVEDLEMGLISDHAGYYVIPLPKGRHFINFHFLGKKDVRHQVVMNADGYLDIELTEKVTQLRGVEVVADRDRNVAGLQVGLAKVDIKTIKELPSAMGEADVVKAALLLPGVQTVGEGASGFNVRGGSTDQNLFLINNAPIFNSSHLFGFFSVFNPDVISEFKLYKSGIPAVYGGRISSVFDINTKNGNKKKFAASGGISPITGRLMVEGPIIRDKTSFIIGARSTYSDWILKRINNQSIRNSNASFYDANAKIHHEFNKNNSLVVSGYYSNDYFKLNSDTVYDYTNLNASVSWKHLFSEKLIGLFSGIFSRYNYNISSTARPVSAFEMAYEIDYKEFKADLTWFPRYNHKVNFGLNSIWYLLSPGDFYGKGPESIISPVYIDSERGLESALYISDEYTVNPRLSIYAGIRLSGFMNMGPGDVYSYIDDLPRETYNIVDTVSYSSAKIIKPYFGPELRFSVRYRLGRSNSIKLSYNRMRQYLHMLSNTTAISPTDTWKLSDSYIRPQIGDQVAIGYYHDFYQNSIETSAEIYYKNIKDMIEYKGGAELLLNETIETDLVNGKGRAYGFELMIKKKAGSLNGWIGYTYSRALIQVTSDFLYERINDGEYFPANHDKPHDFTMVGNFKFSRRFSMSSSVTYSTGRPITFPVARYYFRQNTLLHYSNRNEFRIPDYFRWDLSVNLEGNLKIKKLAHSSWSLSVYNVTGRDNVYSIYFTSKEGRVNGYQMSIFSQPITTLTYNFRF